MPAAKPAEGDVVEIMSDKRVLVTGASNGIGLATACELARMGADVVLHVRDEARGDAARERIARETGSERTELLLADFADLREVRRAAGDFCSRYDRLDVLVANAGAIYPERRTSAQGNELTFQVNHLAHFQLCDSLAPLLEASAPSRVVTVSSDSHQAAWRGIRLDDPNHTRRWGPFQAYAHAKLANIMYCYEHARRLAGTGVTSTVVHPGLVRSGFGAEGYGVFGSIATRVISMLGASPEVGADTVVWLASSPDVESASGVYFYRRKPHRSSGPSYRVDEQRGLWEVSEELTLSCR